MPFQTPRYCPEGRCQWRNMYFISISHDTLVCPLRTIGYPRGPLGGPSVPDNRKKCCYSFQNLKTGIRRFRNQLIPKIKLSQENLRQYYLTLIRQKYSISCETKIFVWNNIASSKFEMILFNID